MALLYSSGGSSMVAITAAPASGTTNNYDPGDTGNGNDLLLWLTPAGTATLTGLVGGVEGRRCVLMNLSPTFVLTLNHQDSNSTATNRFMCIGSANLAIPINGGLELVYTASRWRTVTL